MEGKERTKIAVIDYLTEVRKNNAIINRASQKENEVNDYLNNWRLWSKEGLILKKRKIKRQQKNIITFINARNGVKPLNHPKLQGQLEILKLTEGRINISLGRFKR